MGAAVKLLLRGPVHLYCVLFAAISVFLEIRIFYRSYSAFLKWLTFSLFAHIGTIFVVQMNWIEVLRGIFVSSEKDFLASLTAVLGTTIVPYLLFWQPEEEVEQMNSESKEKPLVSGTSLCRRNRRIRGTKLQRHPSGGKWLYTGITQLADASPASLGRGYLEAFINQSLVPERFLLTE